MLLRITRHLFSTMIGIYLGVSTVCVIKIYDTLHANGHYVYNCYNIRACVYVSNICHMTDMGVPAWPPVLEIQLSAFLPVESDWSDFVIEKLSVLRASLRAHRSAT